MKATWIVGALLATVSCTSVADSLVSYDHIDFSVGGVMSETDSFGDGNGFDIGASLTKELSTWAQASTEFDYQVIELEERDGDLISFTSRFLLGVSGGLSQRTDIAVYVGMQAGFEGDADEEDELRFLGTTEVSEYGRLQIRNRLADRWSQEWTYQGSPDLQGGSITLFYWPYQEISWGLSIHHHSADEGSLSGLTIQYRYSL